MVCYQLISYKTHYFVLNHDGKNVTSNDFILIKVSLQYIFERSIKQHRYYLTHTRLLASLASAKRQLRVSTEFRGHDPPHWPNAAQLSTSQKNFVNFHPQEHNVFLRH